MNAPMPAVNARQANLDFFRQVLRQSVAEVFSKMLGADVQEPFGELCHESNEISGMVGLAGALGGIVTLRCGDALSRRIASELLGAAVSDSACHTEDAIGEMCNMIAGNFKANIPGIEDKCMLSVPTVVCGADYKMHCLEIRDVIEIRLTFESSPIWVTLEMRD